MDVERQEDGVALVTGAGRGIGRTIATRLAARGTPVLLLSRTRADLEEVAGEIADAGGTALVAAVDVTEASAVRRAIGDARTRLGPIDLGVHCAGTAQVVGPLWETDLAAWWAEVEVHLHGAAVVAHALIPDMVARGEGRIVNVYGNLGDRGGSFCSAYACGKAGLLRLTEHLNAETQPHGVRIFAVHPGLVETPMTRHLATDRSAQRWLPRFRDIPPERWHPPENAGALVAAIAAGRLDGHAGRLLGAWEELDHPAEPLDEDERTLRVVPAGRRIAERRDEPPRS